MQAALRHYQKIGTLTAIRRPSTQSKPHRPDIECPTLKGLYLIGDTVRGDGCSGDISFSSVMKAADKILGA
jgi:hypothetical protein